MPTNLRAPSRALLLTLLWLRAAQAQDPLPAAWRPVVDRFASKIKANVEADNAASITAGIALGDRLIWAQGFGWADRDKKIAATPATIYRVGSISKSFTAVALMQAVQRGQVDLDQPVTKYLPEAAGFAGARPGAPPPTMRQLASHTAGLIREPRLPNAAAGPIAQWEDKVIASIPTTRFDTVPGARYAYSNIGFGVLGLAISRAAAGPFMTLVNDGIFQPVGMRSSTYIIDDRLRPNLSVGYTRQGGADPAREHDGRGYKVPNGGVYSTVGDLARFIALMDGSLGDRVLTARSRAELMRVQTPGDPRNGYGLGFSVNTAENGSRTVGHGGGMAGYTSYYVFDPEARIGVILLRNSDFGQTNLGGVATELLHALVAARR